LRILVADDDRNVRTALRRFLERNAMWQVCGEAENGLEAVKKSAEIKPDVVILDYAMPEMDGLEAARQIRSASPQVPILMYTAFQGAVESGLKLANSYVRKIIRKDSPNELLNALESLVASIDSSCPVPPPGKTDVDGLRE